MPVDVLIIGATGMLGHMIGKVLKSEGLNVRTTARNASRVGDVQFDASVDQIAAILNKTEPRYVVNSIGIIKPHIVDTDEATVLNAIRVNSIFPHELAMAAKPLGAHIVQIATDCVYDGTGSDYDESSPHNPIDVYGKTKSLGEVPSDNVLNLRASIIGPEVGRNTSLWEWVRSQDTSAQVNGYTNHHWNGVTTFHFAKVVNAIIQRGLTPSGVRHLVPSGSVTKAELVREIAKASGRDDLAVNDFEAPIAIDRTLSTTYESFNADLWRMAGYDVPPTISEMVRETPLG